MKLGSLCSGAGGLDLAVEAVFGATTAWHCELNGAAAKVLAHRWPTVPNHGDLINTDWAQVEPVDIVCAGWPCQPFSLAGKRKGADDDRALWPYIAGAVRMVRPRIVVLENVAAVLGPEFQRVANDLAALGYDIAWTCLRASDIGAPHRRDRLFVVATDTERVGQQRPANDPSRRQSDVAGRDLRLQPDRCAEASSGWPERQRRRPAADSSGVGWNEWRPESAGFGGGSDAAVSGDGAVELLPTPRATRGGSNTETVNLLPTPLSNDWRGGNCASDMNRATPKLAAIEGILLPTPAASDGTGGGQHPDRREGHTRQLCDYALLLATPSSADGGGGHLNRSGDRKDELLLPGQAREMAVEWGKYEPAIRRWEQATRPAPAPTEPNRNGNPRLAPAFSEWLMGWPAGWVTAVPGLSRNDQLRIIGNGVVPQQAAAALQHLLAQAAVAA